MSATVNHLDLYRLPWNLCDNAISWLEPTAQCNLACDGCYRANRVEHKSFEQTLHELDVFGRLRRSDGLSIAGGDPLLYPDLVRTVDEARRRGYKPIVNTNGKALTPELVRELKQAGLAGFTFHVDSKQGRPGPWKSASEVELNALRDELADMAAAEDVGVAFNATVYPDTLEHVPDLVSWAERRMDVVDVMVLILYRDMPVTRFRFYDGNHEVADMTAAPDQPKRKRSRRRKGDVEAAGTHGGDVVYNADHERAYDGYLTADDIVATLRGLDPTYRPAAYLNGSHDPSSFKWLLSGRVGRPGETYGWVGPKFMEIVQTAHHLFKGSYLAYAPPKVTKRAEPLLLLAPFDSGVRTVLAKALRAALRSPLRAMRHRLCFQGLVVIQPIDILPDGRMNMCDGCPDMTVFGDEMVWSCRMDEQERYGRNLRAEPRPLPS